MTLPRNFPRHEGIVLVTVILLAIASRNDQSGVLFVL